ncbi:MAG: hypothetical protein ACD_8C00144G0006 [uncultured bacterium]|nr:MAG: hypothetical protein ACD_8C00144G0006 [uncultured bacterium]
MSYKLQKGFSLVEVLVSLMVLSIGLLGVSALMVGNIKSAANAKDQVIASALAQEGVELIRNFKFNNSNFVTEVDALDGRDYMIYPGQDYTIGFLGSDRTNTDISSSGGLDKCVFYFYNALNPNGAYVQGSGLYANSDMTPTRFFRKARVDVASGVVTVTVFVGWNGGTPFLFTAGGDDITGLCTLGNKCLSVTATLQD